ncbi:MAG: hypothetical protein IH986_13425 [Planctomycetes bacterium]|nr:hypothetical protein [Planctomycetota bacterium]
MTQSLCQRGCGADRTIRLFSGGDGPAREIDANPFDRRGRTRGSCRRGRSIPPLVLCEQHYDECTAALPPAGGPR